MKRKDRHHRIVRPLAALLALAALPFGLAEDIAYIDDPDAVIAEEIAEVTEYSEEISEAEDTTEESAEEETDAETPAAPDYAAPSVEIAADARLEAIWYIDSEAEEIHFAWVCPDALSFQLTIVDNNGEELLSAETDATEYTLPASEIPSGTRCTLTVTALYAGGAARETVLQFLHLTDERADKETTGEETTAEEADDSGSTQSSSGKSSSGNSSSGSSSGKSSSGKSSSGKSSGGSSGKSSSGKSSSGKSSSGSSSGHDDKAITLDIPDGLVTALIISETELALSLDGGERAFTAVLNQAELTLTPDKEGERWEVSIEALAQLYRAGVQRVVFGFADGSARALDITESEETTASDAQAEAMLILRADGAVLSTGGLEFALPDDYAEDVTKK